MISILAKKETTNMKDLTISRDWQEHELSFEIRLYQSDDAEFILQHSVLLTGDVPAWRQVESMRKTMYERALHHLEQIDHLQGAIFIATDRGGEQLGYAMVADNKNFTGEPEAYLSELVVVPTGEGRGIGRALIQACYQWAEQQGYTLMALETGAANHRARQLYEHLDFQYESVRMVKIIRKTTN
jgi:GNAT superfamily N-acetyltransferase